MAFPKVRPFMIVVQSERPSKIEGKKEIAEMVHFYDRLKPKLVNQSCLVIDIFDGKCIRNTFEFGDDQMLVEQYLKKYYVKARQACVTYLRKQYPDKTLGEINQLISLHLDTKVDGPTRLQGP